MKKTLLAMTALFAMSIAAPAFANEEKPAGDAAEKKPAKKGKGKKGGEEKPAEKKAE